MTESQNDRRQIMKHSATAGAAVSVDGLKLGADDSPSEQTSMPDKPIELVRVGFVGVSQSTTHQRMRFAKSA